MGLLLSFYDDAGIIAINEHLFSMLEVGALDADGEAVQVVDAVASLRFFVRLLELGANDALVAGSDVQALIQASFPSLHALLTGQEYGVRPPRDSRLDYTRFVQNFRHLMVCDSIFDFFWKQNFHLLVRPSILMIHTVKPHNGFCDSRT